MAHALVMAITAIEGSEDDAFTAFQRYFPGATLLIDTYDTEAAAERLAAAVAQGETQVASVRLDSGDLLSLSQAVRRRLPQTQIFVSGDLDEYAVERLKQQGAAIDGYGLGTKLVTGEPVNGVYKLVDIDGIPVMKESASKATYPGRKQIFRRFEQGQAVGDRLGLMTEAAAPDEQPLLEWVIRQGQPMQTPESLAQIADRTAASVASLSPNIRSLNQPEAYPITVSADLQALTEATRQRRAVGAAP